jgi:hypothetical protein
MCTIQHAQEDVVQDDYQKEQIMTVYNDNTCLSLEGNIFSQKNIDLLTKKLFDLDSSSFDLEQLSIEKILKKLGKKLSTTCNINDVNESITLSQLLPEFKSQVLSDFEQSILPQTKPITGLSSSCYSFQDFINHTLKGPF